MIEGSNDLHDADGGLPADVADALARARHRFGRLGGRVLYFSTLGSTNDVAATFADAPHAEGLVIVADRQTAGRGRLGRTWFSPSGSGLYVSVVLEPGRARAEHQRATRLLTLAAGVALAEAVEAVSGLRVDLKWPNDLYVERRKLGGILAEVVKVTGAGISAQGDAVGESVLETRRQGALGFGESESAREARVDGTPREVTNVVLGYGINVAPAAYPREFADRATSLESELGRSVDRDQLLVETLAALARRYDDLLDARYDVILDAWRRRAPASVGGHVRWSTATGSRSGVTSGIDDFGALLVRVGAQIERIVAGELSWL